MLTRIGAPAILQYISDVSIDILARNRCSLFTYLLIYCILIYVRDTNFNSTNAAGCGRTLPARTNAAGAYERRRGGRTPPGRTYAAVADERRRGRRTPPGRTNASGADERRRGGRTPSKRTNAAGADERRRSGRTPPERTNAAGSRRGRT